MTKHLWLNLLVMAGVTYLIRMIPLALVTKKIQNSFIRSFLFYVPYAVLGAMTFPAIFYSTSNMIAAMFGTAVAIYLAYREKSLITVALSACVTVFIVENTIRFLL